MRYLRDNLSGLTVFAIAAIAIISGIPAGRATVAFGDWRAMLPLGLGAASAIPLGSLAGTKYEDRFVTTVFYSVVFGSFFSLGMVIGGAYDPLFFILEVVLLVLAVFGGAVLGFTVVDQIRKIM